jgi:hypothetical protein
MYVLYEIIKKKIVQAFEIGWMASLWQAFLTCFDLQLVQINLIFTYHLCTGILCLSCNV